MIETYHQVTCSECSEVVIAELPNMTRAEFRKYLAGYGWQVGPAELSLCRNCKEWRKAVAAHQPTNWPTTPGEDDEQG